MKNALVLYTLLLINSCFSLKCPAKDNCLCLPGAEEFEFQCPLDSTQSLQFVIHVKNDKEILIDCTSEGPEFNIQLLPNITIPKIEKFRMRFCPLPKNGFKEVFDHFGLKHVKALQFGSSNLSNVILTKDYFKGLEYLESLQLNADDLIELEEDVFANTPNLTSLELQLNKINLKKDLFKYIPLLNSLDLSENGIETIPDGLFQNSNRLELVHLWSNNLIEVTDSTFQGLINLKSLEMSSNKIEAISDGAFKSLINLSRINLASNKLKNVASDLFSHNTKLELIILKNNNLKLPEFLFSNLPALNEVDVSNCMLDSIPEGIFQGSQNIKVLHLKRNKLKEIPEKLFQGLQNLEEVYLFENKITRIGMIFQLLRKLKILHLNDNLISVIEKNDFRDLVVLEELFLNNNRIEKINSFAFEPIGNLKKINLSHNVYTGEHNSEFIVLSNAPNLELIDLSHNKISAVEEVVLLINKVNLKFLDLSHNEIVIVNIKDLQPISNKLTVNLEYNNITTVNFAYVDIITEDVKDVFTINDERQSEIFLEHNPLNCDCYNYHLVKYSQFDLHPKVKVMFKIKTSNLNCANPPPLRGFPIETLPQSLLVCNFEKINENEACPKNCSCFWRPVDNSVIFDCSNNNFTEYPELELNKIGIDFNQSEIHLEKNRLRFAPNQNLSFYDNVTKLYLSDNQIERVDWFPPKLEILHLDRNLIEFIDYDVLNMLNSSTLINLTLQDNPWLCECEASNFTNFLRQHNKVVDTRYIQCFNSTKLLRDLNKNDLCHQPQYALIVGLPIMIGVMSILAVLIVYYKYQQPIKVWLYANNCCLRWVTEEELDKDKTYDAFISYSHRDEDFVVQNLLPVLEGGPTPYKLCLHYRNWIPGEFISTQVTNSVLDSRRTLVVLSPNFLESVWGKMEFKTAHAQAMTEKRTRVIILLYGDIEIDKLDDELKAYLKTNTYVKWGDPYFWNKLKYALPHSKRSNSNNQKIANVMSCIDDKFNLVAPVTGSPGSTPPVLSIEKEHLKKHPLNFSDLNTPPAESGTLLVSTGL